MKIAKFIKTNTKTVAAFALGAVLTGGTVYAATVMNAAQVGFDNDGTSLSATDVQGALNELYERSIMLDTIIDAMPKMQTFDKTSLVNTGDTATLMDSRDGNIYTVKKLADGNVWMTQNLRLVSKTISSADSNLPEGETYTVPTSSINQFSAWDLVEAAYLDSYGGYYTYLTATAGWGVAGITSGDAPKDICPKGWRLPNDSEFWQIRIFDSRTPEVLQGQGDPNFVFSGDIYGNSKSSEGTSASFWSSTAGSNEYAGYLEVHSSSGISAGSSSRKHGYSVRCIAK